MSILSYNYSPLNNYDYEDKSFLHSFVDWVSSPCRKVLGGRKITLPSIWVHSQENSLWVYHPASTAEKVKTIAIAILIFPVAIASTAALLLKVLAYSYLKNAVTVQVDNIKRSMVNKTDIDRRLPTKDRLSAYINLQIKRHSWEDVQNAGKFLEKEDAILLGNRLVKEVFQSEFPPNRESFNPFWITEFIRWMFFDKGDNRIRQSYKEILSDALQIDMDEDILTIAKKMNFAYELIEMHLHSRFTPFKGFNNTEKESLKRSLFKPDQNHSDLCEILSSLDDMRRLQYYMRSIDYRNFEVENSLTVLSQAKGPHQPQMVLQVFLKFEEKLDEEELKLVHEILRDPSDDSVQAFGDEIKKLLAHQQAEFKKMVGDDTQSHQEKVDYFLETLELRKDVELFNRVLAMRPYWSIGASYIS